MPYCTRILCLEGLKMTYIWEILRQMNPESCLRRMGVISRIFLMKISLFLWGYPWDFTTSWRPRRLQATASKRSNPDRRRKSTSLRFAQRRMEKQCLPVLWKAFWKQRQGFLKQPTGKNRDLQKIPEFLEP